MSEKGAGGKIGIIIIGALSVIILAVGLVAGAGTGFGAAFPAYNLQTGDLQNEVNAQKERSAELQKSLTSEIELAASLKRDLESANFQLNSNTIRVSNLTKALEITQTNVKELSQQKFELENQKIELESRVRTLNADRDNLQSQLNIFSKRSDVLRQNLTSLQSLLKVANQNNTELQDKYNILQRQKADSDRQASDLQIQIVNLNSQIGSLSNQINTLNSQVGTLNTRVNQLNAQNIVLQQQVNSLAPDALMFRNLSPVSYTRITARPTAYYDKFFFWSGRPVCTGSMEPTFGCNDVLIMYKPTQPDIDKGSIIGFNSPDPRNSNCYAATHRVIGVTYYQGQTWFKTKGDANLLADPCYVPFNAILFKVIGIIYDATIP